MSTIVPPTEGRQSGPTPYYSDASVTVHHGDCLDVIRTLPDSSIDAVVTDPPYGLGFMGKAWDALPPGREWAAECFRVLKPGGHIVAFGGTRTWHRLAVAIEDGGFEVRDSLAWLYGSGFPKSLDVSKAIDKQANQAPLFDEIRAHIRRWRDAAQMTNPELNVALGLATNGAGMARHWTSEVGSQHSIPSKEQWGRLREVLQWPLGALDDVYEAVKDGAARPVVGRYREGIDRGVSGLTAGGLGKDITAPATDDARNWEGWGTALKPAFEPIVVGRKPLVGTVAANVLAHGTGALNIDGCRVEPSDRPAYEAKCASVVGLNSNHDGDAYGSWSGERADSASPIGRWPANVVLDESQAAQLDEQSGVQKDGIAVNRNKDPHQDKPSEVYGTYKRDAGPDSGFGEIGGASRFFYVAKADQSERVRVDGITHPTVKPLSIMRWLVRLVTPPGGVVLEPFAGSGTTVEACILEGFRCVAIEREADYLPLIVQRINRRRDPVAAVLSAGDDGGLFDLLDGGAA